MSSDSSRDPDTGASGSEDSETTRRLFARIQQIPTWVPSLAFGLVFFVAGFFGILRADMNTLDRIHGFPRESATVIAVSPHRGGQADCSEPTDITWRSENPPARLPTTFTQTDTCLGDEVGSTEDLARVVDSRGDVTIVVSDTWSVRQAIQQDVIVAGIFGALAFVVTSNGVRIRLRRLLGGVVRRRRQPPADPSA